MAAFEPAIRRRVGRLASIQAPQLVPLVAVEHDEFSRRLVVVSRHASGVRLHELLRAAREREIVPDFAVALFIAAEVLAATQAFHSLSGLAHGALNTRHIVISPAGELRITDYAFAEAIEAANFSRERLWRELHIAAWMGSNPFSFQADVRHAALVAIALIVGRPLENDDLTAAIDPLLLEVEEAAMICGGRLFADPVGAWLVRALGAGSSEGFADAREAADACSALLTDRERSDTGQALLQLLEDIGKPQHDQAPYVFTEPRLESAQTVIEAPAVEEVAPPIESGITESATEPAPITEMAAEPSSTLGAWPDAAQVDTESAPIETPDDVQQTVALVDEMLAAVDQSATDRRSAAPVFERSAPRPADEPATAVDSAPVEESVEEVPEVAESATPAAAPEEQERRGKKRKKRRGKRGAGAEPPAPQPSAATPASQSISVAPWSPAPVTKSPDAAPSGSVTSASPLSILDRGVAPATPPPAASALTIERGSFQYSAPAILEAHIAQPSRVPESAAVVTAPAATAPQPIRLKSATPQAEAPAAPIRLKSQAGEADRPSAIRLKEQPAPPRQRTVAPPAEPFEPQPDWRERERTTWGIWKYVAVAVVVLGAGFGAMTLKWPAKAKPGAAAGTLVIETTPVGSQIFVDGEVKGLTPATLSLAPGRHEVKLTRRDASHSWTVDIVSGARRVERFDWSALFSTGGVEVITSNAGARVLVDGKLRGVTPLTITDLSPGRHIVAVQSASGNVRRTVKIVAGETTKLDLAIYSGWVVVSAPIDLDVLENGKAIGRAGEGPLMLPAGRHVIQLVNQSLAYSSYHDVEVSPGEEERIVDNPTGTLNINATPWAEVWIDGNRIGETPLANVKIPLGVREVLFKHAQLGERRVTVTVTAKEPVQLAVDMTRPQ